MTDNDTTRQDEPLPQSAGSASDQATRGSWIVQIQKGKVEEAKIKITEEIRHILQRYRLSEFETLILYDDNNSIANLDADRIYAGASAIPSKTKDMLLIVHSSGGSIEPAYLISKTLKRLSKNKFIVAVPRKAKSAATLIALGADEIHMGMVSQLGPIDPQINGLPVLATGNALKTIAELAEQHPNASEMLGKYLINQVPIRTLGYYNRVGESAIQYAERLLGEKSVGNEWNATSLAKHLVNHYKDHGFVIDFDEATKLLGDNIVKTDTPEYKAADEIYKLLDFVEFVVEMNEKRFLFVGNVAEGAIIYDKVKQS